MSNVDHGAGPLYRDGPTCGGHCEHVITRTSEGPPLYVVPVGLETGRRQLSKVPDVWVPYSKPLYRAWYEPIEDEL